MQMPVMDGVSATQEIRRTLDARAVPIVAMTANAMQQDRDRCMAAGMQDVVTKPIDPDQLWQALHAWVRPRPGLGLPARVLPDTPPCAAHAQGMGTVATACVRHAHCPVLLIRDTMGGGFKNVAACADFSPTSLEAVDQAARICTQDHAALHAVHVFQPLWQDFTFPASMPVSTPDFHKQYQQTLLRRLKEWASKLGHPLEYVKPSYAAVEYPGHRTGIVDYAKSNGIDLLVLGTRGKTNMRDVLLGSTAEKVLRDAPCSVLAVRAVAAETGMETAPPPRAVVEPQMQQR